MKNLVIKMQNKKFFSYKNSKGISIVSEHSGSSSQNKNKIIPVESTKNSMLENRDKQGNFKIGVNHHNLIKDIVVGQSLMEPGEISKSLTNSLSRRFTKQDLESISKERTEILERRAELLMIKDTKYTKAFVELLKKDKDDAEESEGDKELTSSSNISTNGCMLIDQKAKEVALMMRLSEKETKALCREEFLLFKAFKEKESLNSLNNILYLRRKDLKKTSKKLRAKGVEIKDYEDTEAYYSSRNLSDSSSYGNSKLSDESIEGTEKTISPFDIYKKRMSNNIYLAILLFSQQRLTFLLSLTYGHRIRFEEVVLNRSGHIVYIFWSLETNPFEKNNLYANLIPLTEEISEQSTSKSISLNNKSEEYSLSYFINKFAPKPPMRCPDEKLITIRLNKHSELIAVFVSDKIGLRKLPKIVFYQSKKEDMLKEICDEYREDLSEMLRQEMENEEISKDKIEENLQTKKIQKDIARSFDEFIETIEPQISNVSYLKKLNAERAKSLRNKTKERNNKNDDGTKKKHIRKSSTKTDKFWDSIN